MKIFITIFLVFILSAAIFAQSETSTLKNKGEGCQKNSDWNCVVETSTKLSKLEPNEPAYLASRGQAYFELNKFAEAESDLIKAMVLVGKHFPLHQYVIGRIAIAKGDRKSATSFFNGAASVLNDPNHKVFQNALEMTKDSSKTDQDLREKYGSESCKIAYSNEKKLAGNISLAAYYVNENELDNLKLVLPCKLELNKQDKVGGTPLFYATQNPDPRFITELFKYGAEPNFAAVGELTPLMMSTSGQEERIESVKALLAGGASPNAKDKNGNDALSMAKKKGYLQSAKLIQEALDKLPKSK